MSGFLKVIWKLCSCPHLFAGFGLGAMASCLIHQDINIYFYIGISFIALSVLSILMGVVTLNIAKKHLPRTTIRGEELGISFPTDIISLTFLSAMPEFIFAFNAFSFNTLRFYPLSACGLCVCAAIWFLIMIHIYRLNTSTRITGYRCFWLQINKEDLKCECILFTKKPSVDYSFGYNVVRVFGNVYLEI